MQLSKICIANFRSIQNLEINISNKTVLMGANNCGKSTILKSIDLFFDTAPRVSASDHYYQDTALPISISISFSHLTPKEVEEFGSAVIEGGLTVVREFSCIDKESGQFSVVASVHPAFNDFRNETNGTKRRSIYSSLLKKFDDLPSVGTVDEMLLAIADWEKGHPSECSAEKIRNFFGAQNVAVGKLRKKTSVRLVPAVREASLDTQDAKKSPVLVLLSDIARQAFENKKEIIEFHEESQKKFQELTDPSNIPALAKISSDLTKSIGRYYSDAIINAEWMRDNSVQLSFPSPRMTLSHRNATVGIEFVGHGLQRAVLFSIVQYLAEHQEADNAENEFSEAQSDIILLIEEPEIYQHPVKQAIIYEAFSELTKEFSKSTGIRIQIIYTTHSEKLVSMQDCDCIQLVRKGAGPEFVTYSNRPDLAHCIKVLADAAGKSAPMSIANFKTKLHVITREASEGFFAEKVVLVEGIGDKAVIEAYFRHQGRSTADEGISVISIEGKTKLDKPYLIFKGFGIPIYVIFDNDINKKSKKQKIETNIILQKLAGVDPPVSFPNGVYDSFAAFEDDLESYLQSELGGEFEQIVGKVSSMFDLDWEDMKKTPAALSSILVMGVASGKTFELLDKVMEAIDRLEQ